MSEKAVRMGTSNLMPPGVLVPASVSPGGGFGAGGLSGGGVYGWAGVAGTAAMVNGRTGMRTQLFTQFMPPGAFPIMEEYHAALHADLALLAEHALKEKGT
jgi:CubicO group peptidase (beta-lactamase class C family)